MLLSMTGCNDGERHGERTATKMQRVSPRDVVVSKDINLDIHDGVRGVGRTVRLW